MAMDFNHGSAWVYGQEATVADKINARIAAASDFYLCRMCPYAERCWKEAA